MATTKVTVTIVRAAAAPLPHKSDGWLEAAPGGVAAALPAALPAALATVKVPEGMTLEQVLAERRLSNRLSHDEFSSACTRERLGLYVGPTASMVARYGSVPVGRTPSAPSEDAVVVLTDEKLAVRHAELQARQEAITARLHARLSSHAAYIAEQKAAPGIRVSALQHAKEDSGVLPSAAAAKAAAADAAYSALTPAERRAAAAARRAAASVAMAAALAGGK